MTEFSNDAKRRIADVSRRSFLRGGTSIAAATALSGVAAPVVALAQAKKHALVLGAGMSGLTAALALQRVGHRVTVIEHQKRIGGRLMSVPLGDGMYSEAGGGRFRFNMPLVRAYVRHFNLPLLGLNDGLPRYTLGGESAYAYNLASWPWPLAPEERNVTLATSVKRYLNRAGLDTDSVLEADWPTPEIRERLDNITLRELFKSVGASDTFCNLFDAHCGTFTSSAQALHLMATLPYHLGSHNVFRIQGGNDRLPAAIAAAIGAENIVLDAPVTHIDQSGPQVRIGTRGGREFTGDEVISTIPFTVLADVQVTPAWTHSKARAFAETTWEKTVKVIVKTKEPTWLAKGVHGWPMAGGDRPWERAIDITGNEPSGHGNIFFYLNSTNAEGILKQPAETRAQRVLDQFREDMPDLIEDVVRAEAFAWSEQPWIKASFGGLPLGGSWIIREWTIPEGRIHFAGDFTTLKSGWVEGAIESGLRAARQIDPEARPETYSGTGNGQRKKD